MNKVWSVLHRCYRIDRCNHMMSLICFNTFYLKSGTHKSNGITKGWWWLKTVAAVWGKTCTQYLTAFPGNHGSESCIIYFYKTSQKGTNGEKKYNTQIPVMLICLLWINTLYYAKRIIAKFFKPSILLLFPIHKCSTPSVRGLQPGVLVQHCTWLSGPPRFQEKQNARHHIWRDMLTQIELSSTTFLKSGGP